MGGFTPQSTRSLEYAFSLKRQEDLVTRVLAADLNKKLPMRTFAPVGVEFPAAVSDRQWYGKGHSQATFWDPIHKRSVIPARTFSLSQLSALWAPAFVMQDVSTSQPDVGGSPTVFRHRFVFKDITEDANAYVTSMIEKYGSAYQLLQEGLAVSQFTLAGALDDHVTQSWEGVARKELVNTDDMPSLATDQVFFKMLRASYDFGAAEDAPTLVTERVQGFNITIGQTLSERREPTIAGEEGLISRFVITDQWLSGNLLVYLDKDMRDLFADNVECALTMVLVSDPIDDDFDYQVEIEIPHFKLASTAHQEDETTGLIQLNFTEDTVLRDPHGDDDDYVVYTVQTDDDGDDILEESTA